MKASFEGHEKIVVVLLAAGAKPDSSGLVRPCVCVYVCACVCMHMCTCLGVVCVYVTTFPA